MRIVWQAAVAHDGTVTPPAGSTVTITWRDPIMWADDETVTRMPVAGTIDATGQLVDSTLAAGIGVYSPAATVPPDMHITVDVDTHDGNGFHFSADLNVSLDLSLAREA